MFSGNLEFGRYSEGKNPIEVTTQVRSYSIGKKIRERIP
jgi:hypothetical protein